MRKNRFQQSKQDISIFTLDDDPIMTSSLQSYFQNVGYHVDTENDPLTAIEKIRAGSYDILLLDFLMTPLYGDQVVERIREFNRDLYIILLTGHKSMAPPMRTMRALDIQGYYEKSDRFDQLELLVESCAKSIRQLRLIRKYQQNLSEMAGALPALYKLNELDQLGKSILDSAEALWNTKDVYLSIWEDMSMQKCQRFVRGTVLEEVDGDTPEDVERNAIRENMLSAILRDSTGCAIGYLGVLPDGPQDIYSDRLFRIFAKQCEASLGNYFLMHRVRENYMDMIKSIRLMVDAKDIFTRGHSDRVAYYAGKLAEALGKDPQTVLRVRLAGLFHDVGKMAVPESILLSPGRLSDEERKEIQKHAEYGDRILSGVSALRQIAFIVRGHHERIDGKGYPDGLSGPEIPEESRIISVADTFDAMTSTRRYRKNMTLEEAVRRLKEARGTQLDAGMVDVFLESVVSTLPGDTESLNQELDRILAEEEFQL